MMTSEPLLQTHAAGGSVCRSLHDELMEEPAPPLLRDGEDNPFRNSWEAEAFAMGNLLIKNGFMTVAEWVQVFSEEIKAAQLRGDPDRGDTYYSHWMSALERIFIARGVIDAASLDAQQKLWGLARKNTPHGVALSLENALHAPEHLHHHHEHDEPPPEEMLRPIAVSSEDRPMEISPGT